MTDIIKRENNQSIPSYVSLKRQVEDLILYQAQIEKQIKGQNSPFRNFSFKTKKFFYEKILRRKSYTLEELFDIQITNTSCMNSNLKGILISSRKELEYLEDYYQKVYSEFCSNLTGVGGEKSLIKEKLEIYSKVKEEFFNLNEKDEHYFKLENDLKNLKKEISESLHQYNLMNESIVDLGQEKEFLNVIEDLMRTSIQTCERVGAKVKRMERHVSNTKKTYDALKKHQVTVVSLYDAVDTLTKFTMQVHDILGQGLTAMAEIANNPNNLNNFYTTANSKLSNILKDVNEANNKKNAEIEELVKEYIKS